MVRLSHLALASCSVLVAEAFTPSAPQCLSTSGASALCMQGDGMSRRAALQSLGGMGFGAFLAGQAAFAEGEEDPNRPLIPESEMIKPKDNACYQGVGGTCDKLAEGNPYILELQKKSAANRLKYQKQELESYWNRNYKDFFDAACTSTDKNCQFEQYAPGKWRVRKQDDLIRLKETPSK